MKVVSIEKTLEACPCYYDAKLKDGRLAILRYRWGTLSLTVSKTATDNSIEAYQEGEVIFNLKVGDEYAATLYENDLATILIEMILKGFLTDKSSL